MLPDKIIITSSEIPYQKEKSLTIRDYINKHGCIVIGKRRFYDLVGMGLGYSLFYELTNHALKINIRHDVPAADILSTQPDTIIKCILPTIEKAYRKTKSFLRYLIRTLEPKRELLQHHLSVDLSRSLYHSDRYGMFHINLGPISQKCRQHYGISQYWVITLSVAGLSGASQYYLEKGQSIDLAEYLYKQWSTNDEVFGFPNELIIKKNLHPYLDGINALCNIYGIKLTLVDGKNRAHTSITRHARDQILNLPYGRNKSINTLNQTPQSDFSRMRLTAGMKISLDKLNKSIEDKRMGKFQSASISRENKTHPAPLNIQICPSALPAQVIDSDEKKQEINSALIFSMSDRHSDINVTNLDLLWNYTCQEGNSLIADAYNKLDFKLVNLLKRVSIYSKKDYDYQRKMCMSYMPEYEEFFDSIYFEALQINRIFTYPGASSNTVYKIDLADDLLMLLVNLAHQNVEYLIINLGDSLIYNLYTYFAVVPNKMHARDYVVIAYPRSKSDDLANAVSNYKDIGILVDQYKFDEIVNELDQFINSTFNDSIAGGSPKPDIFWRDGIAGQLFDRFYKAFLMKENTPEQDVEIKYLENFKKNNVVSAPNDISY